MIAKKVYIGECVGSGLVGRLRKRWIDLQMTVKKKRLNVGQSRLIMRDEMSGVGL